MHTPGLALLGQYLSAPPATDPTLPDDRQKLAGTIARLRSPVVLRAPDGRVQPLFPFCHGHLEGEPVRLLDGYYLKDAESETLRHTLYYLGDIRRLPLDDGEPVGYPAPCTAGAELRRMLDAHRVQWHLKREDLALWSIRDSVNDYSRRTVAELGGTKYIPAAYLDRPGSSALASRSLDAARPLHRRARMGRTPDLKKDSGGAKRYQTSGKMRSARRPGRR